MNGPENMQLHAIKAFVRLRSWTTALLDEAAGPAVALQAAAAWFRSAARGQETAEGPYAHLYYKAADIVSHNAVGEQRRRPQDIILTIPGPTSEQSAFLAQLYSVIYMMALYAEWTEDEVRLIMAAIGGVEHSKIITVRAMLDKIMEGPVGPSLRRAVEALNGHKCLGDDKCAQASVLWEDEDKRSDRWLSVTMGWEGRSPWPVSGS
jgi:hypothetical protein